MKKHYKSFLCVLLIPIILLNSVNVYAKDWSDYVAFTGFNLLRYGSLIYGFVCDDHNADEFLNKFYEYGTQAGNFTDSKSMEEWWRRNLKVKKADNSDSEDNNGDHLEFTNEFKTLLNTTINNYKSELDQEKAFHYESTFTPDTFLKASYFNSPDLYQATLAHLKGICNNNDYVICKIRIVFQ